MPLANEFQQKMQQQAKEIREQALPAQNAPREHPEDIVIVKNILVGDETEMMEVIPYAEARQESITPSGFGFSRQDSHIYEHHWNTKDYFEVRWDGRPHKIKPGETRFFPRYLADHFAKNLIDFILTKREEAEKVTGLLKNRGERARLYKQIIVGVSQYYNGDVLEGERDGFKVERQVEQMNTVNAIDIGEVPNPALGYGTTDKPPEKVEEIDTPDQPGVVGGKPLTQEQLVESKSRQMLMKEAKALGIEVTPQMTKEQLAAAILNF